MNKQQILEAALLKAHRNGWEPLSTIPWKNVSIEQWQGNKIVGIALLYQEGDAAVQWVRELEGIIFNHDFAKALWPKIHPVTNAKGEQLGDATTSDWSHHLMRMVVAEDPIKYLGENI